MRRHGRRYSFNGISDVIQLSRRRCGLSVVINAVVEPPPGRVNINSALLVLPQGTVGVGRKIYRARAK
jgi:hypothetical protein